MIITSLKDYTTCLRMNEKPFEEKQFKDLDSIALFMQAINESNKMNGILDYIKASQYGTRL